MSGRGYAKRNLPSFFANSFGTLDRFKVDCKAKELTQGHHLVISMMDTSLKKTPKHQVYLEFIMSLLRRPRQKEDSSPLSAQIRL